MFGGLRVSQGSRTVERFPTRQTASLLAYLALHPRRAHSREFLAELLWPDADLDSQRHSLRLALSRIRSLLGPDHPLEAGRQSVRLDPARFVADVTEFEAAVARGDTTAARRLYVGPLLLGHYDDWIVSEQHRLELLFDEIRSEAIQSLNLPRLIGRQSELASVQRLLGESPVVTLTGPGGIGKTRLAYEVAFGHRNGVWVSLIDLSDPGQVADAMRTALGLPAPAPGADVLEYVAAEFQRRRPLLLVLDNAEQLLGTHLNTVVSRLCRVRGVSMLVTSRRALEVRGEATVSLTPLSEYETICLFVERTRRVRANATLSEAALQRLAGRLGGMPLAIELAAARIGVQSVDGIAGLSWVGETGFGEAIGIPPRHRSLQTVLQESLDELTDADADAFRRLAAFRGGFDADSARAVAGADLSTLETLRRWALIQPDEATDGSVRFLMPEPLRELALKDNEAARRAHAYYFADWIEANRADDLPPEPRPFAYRLGLQELERDNLMAALDFCRSSVVAADREAGLRIVAALWTHWYVRNAGAEMERWTQDLLAGPGEFADPLVRAAARLSIVLALRERGASAGADLQVQAALDALILGPRNRNLAFAWHLRGLTAADLGRHEAAEAAYLRSEEIWTEIGDLRNYAVTRHNRGMLAAELGHLDQAEAFVAEAIELFRTQNSTYMGVGNSTMASIRRARGDLPGAVASLTEAGRILRQLGYVRGYAQVDRDLALCLHAMGEVGEATTCLRGVLEDFRRVGDRHGEATALAALARVTGESWYADEARGLLARHQLPAVGELLGNL
ncbi:MAG: XRE family transcriptional regulator [Chthonomonas sp.]